mmetsp:Transcript_25034/g.63504  ORF Transcript_25034/g.63504 Transcript_25034/m.63504 type:complete len:232 (-) Transcript_25034:826-1521(-)
MPGSRWPKSVESRDSAETVRIAPKVAPPSPYSSSPASPPAAADAAADAAAAAAAERPVMSFSNSRMTAIETAGAHETRRLRFFGRMPASTPHAAPAAATAPAAKPKAVASSGTSGCSDSCPAGEAGADEPGASGVSGPTPSGEGRSLPPSPWRAEPLSGVWMVSPIPRPAEREALASAAAMVAALTAPTPVPNMLIGVRCGCVSAVAVSSGLLRPTALAAAGAPAVEAAEA